MGQKRTLLPCNAALRNVETIRGISSLCFPNILFTGAGCLHLHSLHCYATHLTGVVSVVSDVIEHGAAADKQKHRICKARVFPIDREVCDVEMFCHSDILPGPSPGWSSSSSSPAPCLL